MKKLMLTLSVGLFITSSYSQELPTRYTELLDYVQEAPDQGETGTCLFVASTGAMELIANKKEGIKHPQPYGKYDLSESFLIHAPVYTTKDRYFWEVPVLKFNHGYGIHINEWPYSSWNGGNIDLSSWDFRSWSKLPRIPLPKVETIPLFVQGNKWSTRVLNEKHISKIKEALLKYRSPVLVNYNEDNYWHVVLIVGFDDRLPGECYRISDKDCGAKRGSFYVRDSFGRTLDIRDYDWFRVLGNAAFSVKEAP